MKVANLPGASGLADPGGSAWSGVESTRVALSPVPLDAQPNEYIREAWRNRPYGQTAEAKVAAATDGKRLYVRLEWKDGEGAGSEFHDAAGAIFPAGADGSLGTLGEAEKPLAVWFWEDGRPAALALEARGPGVFRRSAGGAVEATGALAAGSWALVLAGPAAEASKGRLGVAVWNGANDERAGLAAVSSSWLTLETD